MEDDEAQIRWLILEDGTQCKIHFVCDIDGDETDDPELAMKVLAELPDGRFIVHDVDPEMYEEHING